MSYEEMLNLFHSNQTEFQNLPESLKDQFYNILYSK